MSIRFDNGWRRMFTWLVIYSLVMATVFTLFQYRREREIKAEELDARLQMVNSYILTEIENVGTLHGASAAAKVFPEGLRITIIGKDGKVSYDTSLDTLPGTNHLNREEIAQAAKTGHGYAVRRHSESTGDTYFYSAQRGDNGVIVRTALPYNFSLNQLLRTDYGFVWVMALATLAMCAIGYIATRRLSRWLARRAAARENREKQRLKRQLTNNINHELKTPVAAIQVCLETLHDHPDLPADKREEFVDRGLAQTSRLKSLLDDVATITRLDDGHAQIKRSRIDLAAVITEAVNEALPSAEAHGIILANRIVGPIWMEGNEHLVMSVFQNLIGNAIMHSGGTRVSVEQISRTSESITVAVVDNGQGVPAEHLHHIFERFYRVDKGRSRASGGTGLGLAIVKNAIQWHGGEVAATNRRPSGLAVTVTLPLAPN